MPVPLGDSITEITCWRALVWDQLAEAGLADKVQYVGSQNSNPQNCQPKTANWDQHHEGHSGWLAVDIANNYLTNWLKSTPADVVMFMLGTNDVVRGKTTDDVIAAYTKMVGIIRAANPKTKIIVSLSTLVSTTPWTPETNTPFPLPGRPRHPPLLLQRAHPGHQRAHPRLGRRAQHHRVAHRHRRLLHGLPDVPSTRWCASQPGRRPHYCVEGRAVVVGLCEEVVGVRVFGGGLTAGL
jgi:hypothetical protein